MIIYKYIRTEKSNDSDEILYILEDVSGNIRKYTQDNLLKAMLNIEIGVANLTLTKDHKSLVNRPLYDIKYKPYKLLGAKTGYDRRILIYVLLDERSKSIELMSSNDILESVLDGGISLDVTLDKLDSNLLFTYSSDSGLVVTQFNSILNGFQINTEDLELDIIKNIRNGNIDTVKTDIGPVFDVTNYLTEQNIVHNLTFFNFEISYDSDDTGDKADIYIRDLKSDKSIGVYDDGYTDINFSYKIIYNPYKSKLEIMLFSGKNTLVHFTLDSLGFLSRILGMDSEILNSDELNMILGCRPDESNSELIKLLRLNYNPDISYSEICDVHDLGFYYHLKYNEPELKTLIKRYYAKINILKLGDPGITHFDLSLVNGRVILNKIVSGKSNISIKIPDWIWDISGNTALLSENIKNATITFTRPIVSSGIFDGCCKIESLKLNNLNIDMTKSTSSMFEYCFNLREIYFDGVFDLRNCESIDLMFYYCERLEFKNIHSINPFKTSNKCKHSYLTFGSCHNLGKVDLSDWEFNSYNSDTDELFQDSNYYLGVRENTHE